MLSRVRAFVLVGAGVLLGVATYFAWPRPNPVPPAPNGPSVLWEYEAAEPGAFVAAPWIGSDLVFSSAVHERGLRQWGAVHAIDANIGKRRWSFDADRAMKPTASAPVFADGRLYFGEGMHAHFVCQFRCLEAATGRPIWQFETTDHIESTPTVAGGLVYFGAGNDGVYALDAGTGTRRWQFAEEVHIDASPCVAGGKVFVGSGPSRRYKNLRVIALDAATGRPLWRTPVDLPAWGSPRAVGGRVFVGLGNGRLTVGAKPPEVPAGAVVCLDETDGHEIWTVRTADAVFQQPTVSGDRVYFGSRDGLLYAVRAESGDVIYKLPMDGPIIAPPTVAEGKVYVATLNGMLYCLEAEDGRERWRFDVKQRTQSDVVVTAAVRIVGAKVYLATELKTGAGSLAILYCLEE